MNNKDLTTLTQPLKMEWNLKEIEPLLTDEAKAIFQQSHNDTEISVDGKRANCAVLGFIVREDRYSEGEAILARMFNKAVEKGVVDHGTLASGHWQDMPILASDKQRRRMYGIFTYYSVNTFPDQERVHCGSRALIAEANELVGEEMFSTTEQLPKELV